MFSHFSNALKLEVWCIWFLQNNLIEAHLWKKNILLDVTEFDTVHIGVYSLICRSNSWILVSLKTLISVHSQGWLVAVCSNQKSKRTSPGLNHPLWVRCWQHYGVGRLFFAIKWATCLLGVQGEGTLSRLCYKTQNLAQSKKDKGVMSGVDCKCPLEPEKSPNSYWTSLERPQTVCRFQPNWARDGLHRNGGKNTQSNCA